MDIVHLKFIITLRQTQAKLIVFSPLISMYFQILAICFFWAIELIKTNDEYQQEALLIVVDPTILVIADSRWSCLLFCDWNWSWCFRNYWCSIMIFKLNLVINIESIRQEAWAWSSNFYMFRWVSIYISNFCEISVVEFCVNVVSPWSPFYFFSFNLSIWLLRPKEVCYSFGECIITLPRIIFINKILCFRKVPIMQRESAHNAKRKCP